MACQKFVVSPAIQGSWTAKLGTREAGPYASQDLAIQVAVAEAGQIRSVDHHVCIVVEDVRGDVSAARCTCSAFEQMLAER